jgi:hypothetical protein
VEGRPTHGSKKKRWGERKYKKEASPVKEMPQRGMVYAH